MKRFWYLAVIAGLMAACGPGSPIYETTYEQVAPHTPQGNYCATSCVSARQSCSQSCSIIEGQCKIGHKQKAQEEFQAYVLERERLGRPLKKDISDFEYGIFGSDISGCEASQRSCEDNCFTNFSQCYTSCGGQVIPHTRCVDNCQTAQPMPGY